MEIKAFPSEQVREEKVEHPKAKGVYIRVLIGPDLGADKFHMRRFRVEPGGHTPLHTHDWEHEVFVLAGSGEAIKDSGSEPIAPGHAIFVPPNLLHQFKNTGDTDLEFLCLIPAIDPA